MSTAPDQTEAWTVEGRDGLDVHIIARATCKGCGRAMAQRDNLLWVHVHSIDAHCDPVMGTPTNVTERPDRCELCDRARPDLNEWVERGRPRMVCNDCLADA